MARLRTFIGVEATDEIRSAGQRLIRKMSQTAAGVRWVDAENIHLTLKFLGEVDEREIHQICRQAADAARVCAPFQIPCLAVGAFPSPHRPRTIWMGVNDHEGQLAQLHKSIETGLSELGIPAESRRFHGHLTLGRVRYNRRGSEDLTHIMAAEADVQFGVLPVDEVIVYSSQLSRSGPTYMALGRCPLGESP